ncbi:hypothetical protein [Gloeobacter kilaueensis]|uniref:Uncharacterized protein n=1 Tax=Gloeobacter kilaueensis (strain ATCC BAA-2537 / CCAP 1431/1 / ULC 316 / JS1) TaxID=1183438 RepID=U5QP31_GLOK1|nr:hypothetical protein [Gloeobacter kilaueensis]AGY60706.1 hypothetical protein GKIL_4460 [Gloeobacter kilaueensis JS1]
MVSLAISLLLLLGAIPLMLTNNAHNISIVREDQQAAAHQIERETLYAAIQYAIADINNEGGSRQMQQDFPEAGLSVYLFTEPETIVGQTYPIIRIRATARPLTTNPQITPNFATNNTQVATAAFDPITRIATQVRYIDIQRSN